MSRQIQIRRGSAAEHENFTGAPGEITMDTDAKTLRVHDGQTVGGIALARLDQINGIATMSMGPDAVVDTFRDTNIWYRQYSSGWVEQGGIINISVTETPTQVIFPIEMSDTNYSVQITSLGPNSTTANILVTERDTTLFYVNSNELVTVCWEVKGNRV